MTGKELLKLVHEKSSTSNREMVLFHRENQCGKHIEINSDLVLQVCQFDKEIRYLILLIFFFLILSGEKKTVRQNNTMRDNVNY